MMNNIMKNSMMKSNAKKSKAQGTMEYLVIIAVVIIIGLIVVSMTTNIFNIEQVSTSSNELKGQLGSQGISIIDTSSNQFGDSFLNLKNTSSDVITLTKIQTIGGEKVNEYNAPLTQGNNEIIQLEGLCECETNQTKKTCEIEIHYTTQHGLPKKVKQTITVNCEENSEPTKPPIPPTLPEHCFDLNHNPIWICSLQDLNNIRTKLNGNYILMKDIDATETKEWNNGDGWKPIGTYENSFTGTLNGNNNKINSLKISPQNQYTNDYFGFIGHLSGNIQNIILIDANVLTPYSCEATGILVGYQYSGIISNSSSQGNIKGVNQLGGLVGYQYDGKIINSSSNIEINAFGNNVGGLVGKQNGEILNSFSNGVINNNSTGILGGLVGYSTGDLNNSYANTNVTGSDNVGGLVGFNVSGTITDCYATGNISGKNYTGGLIGNNHGSVKNCYATGNISGENYTGGLIGNNHGSVKNCYTTGNISGENYTGGLIGTSYYLNSIINCYWDILKTGQENCCGDEDCGNCQGKNENNSEPNYFFPQENETYNPPMQNNVSSENNWDFSLVWKKINNNYPILK